MQVGMQILLQRWSGPRKARAKVPWENGCTLIREGCMARDISEERPEDGGRTEL